MRNWLCRNHSEPTCLPGEARDLLWGNPSSPSGVVEKLHNGVSEGNFKHGCKCPNDIGRASMLTHLQRPCWPCTKLLIGLRHPARWFESFWSFRMNNARGYFNEPETLIGSCGDNPIVLCTDRALLHAELSRLGKASMSAPEEVEMKRRCPQCFEMMPPPAPKQSASLYDRSIV